MLIPHTCRQPESSVKQWFSDFDNDLFIWFDKDSQITAFQYSYNKSTAEHMLSWSRLNGYSHGRIDDGEDVYLQIKRSPIIVPDGAADCVQIAEKFQHASVGLESQMVDFIYRKILAYTPSVNPETSRS